jgi:hypothetical protein
VSANFTVLLVAAGIAVAAGSAALLSARGLRRELTALRQDLAGLKVPAPRESACETACDIRTAVADALADERERELAEARAFWAEQEARETAGDGAFFRGGLYGAGPGGVLPPEAAAGLPDLPERPERTDRPERPERVERVERIERSDRPDYEVPPVLPYLPRQADFAGLEPGLDASLDAELGAGLDGALDGGLEPDAPERPETARPAPGAIPHPSGPDYAPSPVVASQDQTAQRLADLAEGRIPLSDVRPGPLGTLDVYVFADGTTLCMTPGHRDTALRLSDALDRGDVPVLRGGSAIAGAYALTFAFGEESVYVLADRVVASL